MPVVNNLKILSVSSEDAAHPAINILSTDTKKKWKSKSSGEEAINVVLKLPKTMQICGIDVGNENSAFVEIFVGKLNAKADDDFKKIVEISTLMTIEECRNNSKPDRVRCFEKGALVESVAKDKWDLVKIVCTQPFTRHLKYGLAVLQIYTPAIVASDEYQELEVKKTKNSLFPASSPFAKFKMREDSPDSESESTGSLFSRWKQIKSGGSGIKKTTPLSAAAAIRLSSPGLNQKFSNSLLAVKPSSSSIVLKSDDEDGEDKSKVKNRNRESLLYDEEDDRPNEKLEKKLNYDRKQKIDSMGGTKSNDQHRAEKLKKITDPASKFRDFLDDNDNKTRGPSTSKLMDRKDLNKSGPFTLKSQSSSPMSSFFNKKSESSVENASNKAAKSMFTTSTSPNNKKDSSELSRSKRQSSPISAPVSSAKKRKPSKRYKPFGRLFEDVTLVISGIQNPLRSELRQKAIELGAKYKADWDQSCTHLICAFKNTPKYNQVKGEGKIVDKQWIIRSHAKKTRIPWRQYALDSDEEAISASEDEILDESQRPSNEEHNEDLPINSNQRQSNFSDEESHRKISDSEPDTEDEIERILQKRAAAKDKSENPKNSTNPSNEPVKDVYDKTTDEDIRPVFRTEDSSLSPLPEFFANKTFYLCDNIGSVDEIKLRRFISVYKGELVNSFSNANFVISEEPISTTSSFSGEIVKPLWVFECNDMECLLPTKRYIH